MRIRYWVAALAAALMVPAARAEEANSLYLASHFGQPGQFDSPLDRDQKVPAERAPEALSVEDAIPSAQPAAPVIHAAPQATEHSGSCSACGGDMSGYDMGQHDLGGCNSGHCGSAHNDCIAALSDDGGADCGCDVGMDIVGDDCCCCDDPGWPELGGLLDCCQACPPTGLIGGVGYYFLKPFWSSNPAMAVIGPGNALRNVDFNYGYQVAPQLWLAWVDRDGLGARMRYFEFEHSANVVQPLAAGEVADIAAPLGVPTIALAGQTVRAAGKLQLNVWDFEITQQFTQNCWTLEIAGGLRYLHMDQHFRTNVDGNPALLNDVLSSHRFNGAGPTIAFKSQRKLGQSNISLYADSRASLLFGDQTQAAAVLNDAGLVLARALDSSWSTVSVLELELGASYQMDFDRFTLTTTSGLVGQYWGGLGNNAGSDVIGFGNAIDAPSQEISMGMFGLRSSVSIAY